MMELAKVIRYDGEDKIRFTPVHKSILSEAEVKEMINSLQHGLYELDVIREKRNTFIKNPEMRGRYFEYERYVSSCDELEGDDIRKAKDLVEEMFFEFERRLEEGDGKSIKGMEPNDLAMLKKNGREYTIQTVYSTLNNLKKLGIARYILNGNTHIWYLSMYGQYMEA